MPQVLKKFVEWAPNVFIKAESLWEKYTVLICIILGVLSGLAYFLGYITNIRSTVGNVITFSSIVIGVNGVFLTLVITLQESPVFERLKDIMPTFQTKLYVSLRTQIQLGLFVVSLSIFISLLPKSPSIIFSAIGVGIWSAFFWGMTIGSFYSVKLVTDIIVKNFNIPTRPRRK